MYSNNIPPIKPILFKMMKLVGEFLGTFVFLYAVAKYGTPLAVGLGLAIAVYAFGHLSGGHYNPAVTFMKLLMGSVSQKTFIKYTAVQLIAAFALVKFMKR